MNRREAMFWVGAAFTIFGIAFAIKLSIILGPLMVILGIILMMLADNI